MDVYTTRITDNGCIVRETVHCFYCAEMRPANLQPAGKAGAFVCKDRVQCELRLTVKWATADWKLH